MQVLQKACILLEKIYKIQSITAMPFISFLMYLKPSKSSWRELKGKRVCNLLCINNISDPAGRSFISCNCMIMDTAIVGTFAITKSINLTFRVVKFVLFSRCLCGSNGSFQQLQLELFFTITLHNYLLHSTKKCSLTCNCRQILISNCT